MVSIDGVHVHRASMVGGLAGDPTLVPLLPFARLFYATPSSHLWHDGDEGGEQVDHRQGRFARQRILARASATSASCAGRSVQGLSLTLSALRAQAGVDVNLGKTRIWNAAGEEPLASTTYLQVLAGEVWTSAWSLPPDQRACAVLGRAGGAAGLGHLQERRAQLPLVQGGVCDLQPIGRPGQTACWCYPRSARNSWRTSMRRSRGWPCADHASGQRFAAGVSAADLAGAVGWQVPKTNQLITSGAGSRKRHRMSMKPRTQCSLQTST